MLIRILIYLSHKSWSYWKEVHYLKTLIVLFYFESLLNIITDAMLSDKQLQIECHVLKKKDYMQSVRFENLIIIFKSLLFNELTLNDFWIFFNCLSAILKW